MKNSTKFQICQSELSFNIFTDNDEIFINLANKMRLCFSRTIGQKNKLITFFNPSEIIQRKYFFKLISKIYARINDEILNIDENKALNIKLVYIAKNSMQAIVSVPLKFDRNFIIFDTAHCDGILLKYFIKMLDLKYDKVANLLRFMVKSANDLSAISDIISFKEHLRYNVNFIYDEEQYKEFCQIATKMDSKAYKRTFSALADLLSEHFLTLGCNIDDDFSVVRANYLRLTKLYHPDNNANSKEKRAKFQEISFAYEALKPYFAQQDKFLKGIA